MSRQKGKTKVLKQNQVLQKLQIVYVPLTTVKPNKYNPNRQSPHEFELLCKSMAEDGFTQPILVMEETNEIVDGEHRWMAAKALGLKEIPIVYVTMTVEQMRISTLRHNRARGTEDIGLTAQVLRDLQELGAMDWAKDSLMLNDEEINRLLEDIPVPETLAGDEYNMGWVPDSILATDEEIRDTAIYTVENSDVQAAVTAEGIQAIRIREQKLKAAKTEEDKAVVRKETQIKRLSLTFTAVQYLTVENALGSAPAENLVKLCERALEKGWTV